MNQSHTKPNDATDRSPLYDTDELKRAACELRDEAQSLAATAGANGFDPKVWGTGATAQAVSALGDAIQAAVNAFDIAVSDCSEQQPEPCRVCVYDGTGYMSARPIKDGPLCRRHRDEEERRIANAFGDGAASRANAPKPASPPRAEDIIDRYSEFFFVEQHDGQREVYADVIAAAIAVFHRPAGECLVRMTVRSDKDCRCSELSIAIEERREFPEGLPIPVVIDWYRSGTRVPASTPYHFVAFVDEGGRARLRESRALDGLWEMPF